MDRTLMWALMLVAIAVVVAVGIWLAVNTQAPQTVTVNTQAPSMNLSNLTASYTCAGSNAGAVATALDSVGIRSFYGGYDSNGNALSTMPCPSGYTSAGSYNGYYTCTPANPKTPNFTPGSTAGLHECQKSKSYGMATVNPPCPKNYRLTVMDGIIYPSPNKICLPPLPPCPAGYTLENNTCLPPASLGNPCPSGTQTRDAWCVPN